MQEIIVGSRPMVTLAKIISAVIYGCYVRQHNVHLFVNDVKRDREQTFDGGITETWAYRYK